MVTRPMPVARAQWHWYKWWRPHLLSNPPHLLLSHRSAHQPSETKINESSSNRGIWSPLQGHRHTKASPSRQSDSASRQGSRLLPHSMSFICLILPRVPTRWSGWSCQNGLHWLPSTPHRWPWRSWPGWGYGGRCYKLYRRRQSRGSPL